VDEFSIELAAERIDDARTRDNFREVLSSFINGNYRSSVVMLWSIVIADLIYKLQALRDLHGDTIAASILTEIENRQLTNPTNPEWESFLIEEMRSRTHFFEPSDYNYLQSLQKLRHLSAHPVLRSTTLLFAPNKETVRAFIRNALEAALLKPPIFTKRIVNEFVTDLAAQKTLLPDDTSLSRYLAAKYFRNLHPDVEDELIKVLWKYCFRLSNRDTDENRDINIRTLQLLYNRRPAEFKRLIESQRSFFSEMAHIGDPDELGIIAPVLPLERLILFLTDRPVLFAALSDAAKVIIRNYAESNINLFVLAPFLSSSAATHIAAIVARSDRFNMSILAWSSLLNWSRENGLQSAANDLAIDIYCRSENFNKADSNFSQFIEPNLIAFDEERLRHLLQGIERNSQTYWRGKARIDHALIHTRCREVLGDSYVMRDYPNFQSSLPEHQ